VLAAGRTAYQGAAAKSSIGDDVYSTATAYSHDVRVPAVALSAEVVGELPALAQSGEREIAEAVLPIVKAVAR
jgi:hypothetical protein